MRIGVISRAGDLGSYVVEILRTWGLATVDLLSLGEAEALSPETHPVLIWAAPAPPGGSVLDFTRSGGTAVCFEPGRELARAVGLEIQGRETAPLRLRVTGLASGGLTGELLPVVGGAALCKAEAAGDVLAWLCRPDRYGTDVAGLIERNIGAGGVLAFTFDLPRCVLMLRQGDPALAERPPVGDPCPRPSNLAFDIGPHDCGWAPFADLLARLLVDLVLGALPGPAPMLSHLPGAAPAMLLWSGDEDNAETAWNDEELDAVADAGARMSLYIIPTRTRSTPEDVRRYAARHDVGPHPDLWALRQRPMAERLAELERQILLFREMFCIEPRTIRNHCTVWAGYMDAVEVMERTGVRMDGNYFSGCFLRRRDPSPYGAFGAAMPMRFFRPDGRPIDVFQQHTPLADDILFSESDYSYRYTSAQWEPLAERILSDCATRFHTPYAVCIHPSNWVKFSREPGLCLLETARRLGIPVWSFDQWLAFWRARDGWSIRDMTWDDGRLHFGVRGERSHSDLRLVLPELHVGRGLSEVRVDGVRTAWESVARYRRPVALIPICGTSAAVEALYT